MMLTHPERIDVRRMKNLNARAQAFIAGPGAGKTTALEQFFRVEELGVLAFDPVGELAGRVVDEAHVIPVPEDYLTRGVKSGGTIADFVVKSLKKKEKVCLSFADWWEGLTPPVDHFTKAVKLAGVKDILLLCEEAHNYIPQDGGASAGVMKAFAEGRNWRWGRIVASQRPAEVNKKALERCDTLWLGRVQGARDAEAADNVLSINVGDRAQRQEIIREMFNLHAGQFLLREPAHPPGVNS